MSLPRSNPIDRVGGQQGIRRQEGLDGLAKRARLLFLWNRRPRIAATNPQCNPPLRDLGGQWFCWFISEGTGVLVPLFGSASEAPFDAATSFCLGLRLLAYLPLDILQEAWQFCPVVSLGGG
jgi:hypothetical protein